MPRPKYTTSGARPRASRQFTDREEFVEAFERTASHLPPQEHKILVYYGVGGIGKTRLRKELCRRLRENRPEVGWATLDFATSSHRDVEDALSWLGQELTRKYGFRFPSFELALAQFLRKSRPNASLREEEFPFLEESGMLADVISVATDVPGLGVGAKITALALRTRGWLADWWTKRRQRQLYELQEMEPNEIAERLPMFWADDLKYFMQRESRPVVLFIDSYEALWEEGRSEGRFFARDEWVRELVAQLPEVLWVVAGREKLRWGEMPDDWDECLEQHLIGRLATNDARRFLASCGIVEEEIQRIIVEGSEGVPFFLDLAADTYLEVRRQRRKPLPSDFGGTQPRILERFLRYLDRYETETLKVLSVTRFFSQRLFEELIKRFRTGYPATAFPELCRFSFVQEGQVPGTYTMHPLMRASLHEHQNPRLREEVHRYLFDHYDTPLQGPEGKSIEASDKTGLAEAFYHGRHILSVEEFFGWFEERVEAFDRAELWFFLIPLREELKQLAEEGLGAEHPDTATSMNSLALLYRQLGRYSEAEPLHRQTLRIRERAFGSEHPATASSLHCLADLHYDRGQYENAEPLYKRALYIREKSLGLEHPDTATSLNDLALLLHFQGRYEEAEPLYKRAQSIWEKTVGPDHSETALSLNNLGLLYYFQGRYEEAEPLYRRAFIIWEKALGSHPHTATSLNNLGSLCRLQGQYGEAELLLKRALTICEEILGPDHPQAAFSLNNLGLLYHDRGQYAEAEMMYRRALEIRELSLGSEHPLTATSLNNLAILYVIQARCGQARLLLERALQIRERALGRNHPDTARTHQALEDLLKEGKAEST